MASSDVQRKLTAILCADVVGYSRLMGENEKATLRALTEYRQVFSDYIEKHHGRVVNAPGDSILAEFASVVDAVEGAAEIQRELAERNAGLLEERRMLFRIGVNLGDVMVRGEEIYGDGVNIAARLESLAEPGGICVSRHVYDHVKQKLKLHFEYMGEQQVKNIAEPVRAYQVLSKPGDAAHWVVQAREAAETKRRLVSQIENPSVAVLAFENMSSDPEQEFLGDGISEDIITDLSKISRLIVVGRTSSFSYKGNKIDLRQIGQELGVRYILEGSVRKVGNRVRVTTQLIEAATGNHIWAERFDKILGDLFLIGDEITEEVVTSIDVKLISGEQARIFQKAFRSLKGRNHFNRGVEELDKGTQEGLQLALERFQAATEEDPEVAQGYGYGAWGLAIGMVGGWIEFTSTNLDKLKNLAQKALSLDPHSPAGHGGMAYLHFLRNEHDEAIKAAEESVKSKPICSGPNGLLATFLIYGGRPQEAIGYINQAIRLSPLFPTRFLYTSALAYFQCGNYEQAHDAASQTITRNNNHIGGRIILAASCSALGRLDEAKAHAMELLSANPGFTSSKFLDSPKFKEPGFGDSLAANLRKAGLPD